MPRNSVKMQKSELNGAELNELVARLPEVRQSLVARFRFLITTDQYDPSAIHIVHAMVEDHLTDGESN